MQKSLALLAVLGLTACAQSTAFFYKPGTIQVSKQKDYDACKIKSFKEIPQNIVTTYNPGVDNPGTLSCYTIGATTQCNRVGALYIAPSTSSEDVNEGMRARFILDCMNKKGYVLLKMPICKIGETGYNSRQKAPSLDKIKCLDSKSPAFDF